MALSGTLFLATRSPPCGNLTKQYHSAQRTPPQDPWFSLRPPTWAPLSPVTLKTLSGGSAETPSLSPALWTGWQRIPCEHGGGS